MSDEPRARIRPFVLKRYTESQRDQLLYLISNGVANGVACEHTGVPRQAIEDWKRHDPTWRERYERAVAMGCDAIADETIQIADAPVESMEDVQRARTRIQARQWLLSKRAAAVYGERVTADHRHIVGVVLLPALDAAKPASNGVKEITSIINDVQNAE